MNRYKVYLEKISLDGYFTMTTNHIVKADRPKEIREKFSNREILKNLNLNGWSIKRIVKMSNKLKGVKII